MACAGSEFVAGTEAKVWGQDVGWIANSGGATRGSGYRGD